jgi:hypothetical protein
MPRRHTPSRDNVCRPVHPKIDAAKADEEREKGGDCDEVQLHATALLHAGEKHPQGEIGYGRHCRVAAGKAE